MAQTRVVILNEAKLKDPKDGEYALCFQYCRYEFGDGQESNGYRFIWRKPVTGNLIGARGQARIPSVSQILRLTAIAVEEGWGSHNCDVEGFDED